MPETDPASASFSPALNEPLLFHPLKHHLPYIRQFIQGSNFVAAHTLAADLQTIGSSQLDLYLGRLTLQELSQEVLLQLQEQNLLAPEAFRQQLQQNKSGYSLLTLSDASTWVLRWGNIKGRYVHLHPARYAINSMRVKANTLKTAIAVAVVAKNHDAATISLPLVNQARQELLRLSPLKTLTAGDGLLKLITLLLR